MRVKNMSDTKEKMPKEKAIVLARLDNGRIIGIPLENYEETYKRLNEKLGKVTPTEDKPKP